MRAVLKYRSKLGLSVLQHILLRAVVLKAARNPIDLLSLLNLRADNINLRAGVGEGKAPDYVKDFFGLSMRATALAHDYLLTVLEEAS